MLGYYLDDSLEEEARFLEMREEVIKTMQEGSCDVADSIASLDGEGSNLLNKVLLQARENARSKRGYTEVEQLIDSIAQLWIDRETLGNG